MTDSIFEADELAADAVTANDVPEADPAPAAPARDEMGRFAPKDEPEAPADEPTPEPQGEDERARHVPHAALHAEREKRREVESKWKAAQERLDAIDKLRAQVANRKQEVAEPAPVNADPNAETEHLRRRLEQIEGTQHEQQRRAQIEQVDTYERQQIASLMTQSEAEFRTAQPDYDDAVDYVINARAQELALYGLQPHEVQQAIQSEVSDIAKAAIAQGRSPAEVAYQLASLRGYRRAQAPAQQQPSPAQRTVDAVAKARAASRSLGQAPGTGTTRDINAETIASMGIDEFDALYATPEGRKLIDAL